MGPRIRMNLPSSNNLVNDILNGSGQQFGILLILLTAKINHDTKKKINEFSYLMMGKNIARYMSRKDSMMDNTFNKC